MKGIAIKHPSADIDVSANAASDVTVPAVASTPGWRVISEVTLALSSSLALSVTGRVSVTGLTMNARLFDLTAVAPVSNATAAITATTDTTATSAAVSLTGGRSYQIQVEVVGGADAANFGTVTSATLT